MGRSISGWVVAVGAVAVWCLVASDVGAAGVAEPSGGA